MIAKKIILSLSNFFIFCLFLFFALQNAWAFTGEQFLNKCDQVHQIKSTTETIQESIDRALDAGSCTGFVGGVIQGVNLAGDLLRAQNVIRRQFICLPTGIKAANLLEIVLQDLRKQPDDINAPAQLHIYRSIGKKYSCDELEKFGN